MEGGCRSVFGRRSTFPLEKLNNPLNKLWGLFSNPQIGFSNSKWISCCGGDNTSYGRGILKESFIELNAVKLPFLWEVWF